MATTFEQDFDLWRNSAAGRAALAQAAAEAKAADDARVAEHEARCAVLHEKRLETIRELAPLAQEFDSLIAEFRGLRAMVEQKLLGTGGWLLSHLDRDYSSHVDKRVFSGGFNGDDALVATLRHKAERVDVVRRYVAYYRAVVSLNDASMTAYKAAAFRVGPAYLSPAFGGSAVGDGIVIGATLNRLVGSVAGVWHVLNVGGKWPVPVVEG